MDEFVRKLTSLEEKEQMQTAELMVFWGKSFRTKIPIFQAKFQEQNEAIKETFTAVQANAEKEKNRVNFFGNVEFSQKSIF
jgi:hypothetical protein